MRQGINNTVWQFLIDQRYQHKGYGKAALKSGIQFLIDNFNISEVYLGVKFQNTAAQKLYSSFGFIKTGKATDTALEMKLTIINKKALSGQTQPHLP